MEELEIDQWDDEAIKIAERVRIWSVSQIETHNPIYNGPACPFAKSAWIRQKVMIHVTEDLETVVELKGFNPPIDDFTHLVAWTGWRTMSEDEFEDWLYHQNENHFGVWISAFHPGFGERAVQDEADIFSQVDDICILLVQEYEHLVKASEALKKTGYYKTYTDVENEVLKERKERLHAWKRKTSTCQSESYKEGWAEEH
tara:strand:+ start:1051 stop:1650 length:600 start_codon:yes stop_codon:yes gene_type:complete